MIFRNARLILLTDVSATLLTVITSLVGARALGPAGRGDLLLITLWPIVISLLAEMGLPNAYRYWMAKEPERLSRMFTNGVIYTLIVGVISVILGDSLVPYLIAERHSDVMLLVKIYMINVPAVVFLNLMRGLLEGRQRFGWAGAARFSFFAVQAAGFGGLWLVSRLTLTTAAVTMILAQTVSMLLALVAVLSQLRPRWEPSWAEFKNSLHYGLRDYAGGVADYATLRLDQLMLGALASSAAMGLYVVAVRLSEVTTLAACAAADALMPEVAAARESEEAEALLARTLRLTVYANLVILVPLWFAAPVMLRVLFGPSFVPAAGAFRWLLVAAVVWSASAIVIRGLQGFGHPGLTTIARFASAIVTAGALLVLLPRMGITGAAISSLIGYCVMLAVALSALIKRRQLGFWKYLRPQRRDIPFAKLKAFATVSVLRLRGTEG